MKVLSLIACLLYGVPMNSITIVGHRGACGYAPENTLSSFKKAIECNVDMIEFDVRKCASGELVVFHDAKVDRITDGEGYIASKSLQELKQLKVLGAETMVTLCEALDFIDRRVKIYIELKDLCIVDEVLGIIEHYVNCKQWKYSEFIVGSYDHTQLCTIRTAKKEIFVAALLYGIPIGFGSCGADSNAHIICLDSEFITQQLVDDIHQRDMLVYVYTVNDEYQLLRVLAYGIDGIITDFPDDIRRMCNSL